MFPVIYIAGSPYRAYYLALLTGIVVGWFAFVLSEDLLWKQPGAINRLRTFTFSSFYYIIIMVCCIQGASYFHFLFDIIPEHIRSNLALKAMLLTNPIGSTKVLYGAIFFYPLGVFLMSLNNLREKFIPYLDGKTFVLFLVVGFNRVGCSLNGCCYGVQSNLLGFRFPPNSAAAYEHWKRGLTPGLFHTAPSLPVIPTQFIEAVFLFALSYFSWRTAKRGGKDIFVRFVLSYAVFRFFIEFIRDDMDRAYWWIFSASQWLSLMIFIAYAAYRLYRRKGRDAAV
jgi:phosphatidylglycerol:prolipoprotein diacylglycerol transferase